MFRLIAKDQVFLGILALIIVASGSDLAGDLGEGVTSTHLLREGVILTVAVIGIGWILLGLRRQGQEIERLRRELEEARTLPAAVSDRLLDARRNLADVIAEQFGTWELSRSEKEVGQFLLKGLTTREIAMLRGTAEKTIRQQASSIYQKAGVTGRHAFAAWFIEDFL